MVLRKPRLMPMPSRAQPRRRRESRFPKCPRFRTSPREALISPYRVSLTFRGRTKTFASAMSAGLADAAAGLIANEHGTTGWCPGTGF